MIPKAFMPSVITVLGQQDTKRRVKSPITVVWEKET
jgi:hypothetical protein